MTSLRYRGIDDAIVRNVRETLRDAHGNALRVWVSDGDGNPCRSCLRLTPAGTRLILFAHRPFTTGGPYAETGPVFVHAGPCTPYALHETFPEDFLERTLTVRTYDAPGAIVEGRVIDGRAAEDALQRMFDDDRVAFAHVRNPGWGCWDFAVERAA